MVNQWKLVWGCLISILLGMVVLTEQRYIDFPSRDISPLEMDADVVRVDPEVRTLLDILLSSRHRFPEAPELSHEMRKRQRQCYWSAISCF